MHVWTHVTEAREAGCKRVARVTEGNPGYDGHCRRHSPEGAERVMEGVAIAALLS